MKHNKKSLETQIKGLELAVTMEADIREVIAKFRHYKQVNSRFTDVLNEKGYWAYISKDKYNTVLNVRYKSADLNQNDHIDFRFYVSECFEKRPMTWEQIENELIRHNFQGRLNTATEQLKCFEIEKVKFKELCEFMEKMQFKCFDLYEVNRNLKDMLDYANKGE